MSICWLPRTGTTVGIASVEMSRIPDLAGFFPADVRLLPMPFAANKVDFIAGWGLRKTGNRARLMAERNGRGRLLLEDGFVRSAGLGVENARPLSLVLDDLGVHLDASAPSRLETILQTPGWECTELTARARAGIAEMRRLRISKYNQARQPLPAGAMPVGRFVLLVDQTEGDTSIAAGLAGPASFVAMLEAARRENPGRRLMLRLHPDVVAGRRRGCLAPLAREAGIDILPQGLDPWETIEAAECVYTVTSQLGFEAMLAGREVHCFGMPFYAGWGATIDAFACDRRTRRRDAEAIFAAACLIYARYVDPFTGRQSTFESAIDTLATWRRAAELGRSVCVGVSRWKRDSVGRLFSFGEANVVFRDLPAAAVADAKANGGRIVVWATREPPQLATLAASAGVPVARLEDGFIRSVGLGAALVPGLSYLLDSCGVHYDPSHASELEAIIEGGNFPPQLLARAQALIGSLITARVTKYNLIGATVSRDMWPLGRRLILVPGQVEDDASLRLGARELRRNADLLAAVRAENPDALLLWKTHPDVAAGLRVGAVPAATVSRLANMDVSSIDTADLLDVVDEVHVMTSSIGFEALLRGRRVVTHGVPFYAGWGLTEDRHPVPRRTRRVTLDQLAAAALLVHPLYLDPRTGLPCGPELALARLQERHLWSAGWLTQARLAWGWLRRLRRLRSAAWDAAR